VITRSQKIRLGIFMLVSTFFILAFFFYIAGSKLIEDKDLYYIRFTNTSVSGLQIGSSVKYHGIGVGTVEEVGIDPKDVASVIITVSIDDKMPVKSDVRATLSSVGITGLVQVELKGGTNAAGTLPPGSFIQRGTSTLESFTGQAEEITKKMELLLSNFVEITSEENRYRIDNILSNIGDISGDENRDLLREFLTNLNTLTAPETKEKLDRFLDDLNSLALTENRVKAEEIITRLNQVLVENQTRVNSLMTNLDVLSARLVKVGDKAQKIVNDLDALSTGTSRDVDTVMTDLKAFADELSGAKVGELVSNINMTVLNINETVESIDQTVKNVDYTIQDSRKDIQVMLKTSRDLVENLNDFARQISNDPSLLLRQKK